MDHLKQYPEWEHPVSKDHDPRRSSFDDSYVDNALSKMMIKMRTRWDHLEDIREENPGLYIDSMREIAKLVTNLVDAVKAKDHEMGDKHKDLLGTEHAHYRDGPQYFGMGERTAEQIMDMVKGIEQPNARMVWDDPVAHQLRDSMQNYIRSAYSRYYEMKQGKGDGFYRLGPVPEIIKQRTDAIKEFLTGFDGVAQKLGFDSQSSEIANKKQLDKQQAKFQKKHGPQTFKVHAFDFGGYIFAEKGFAQGLPHLAPEGVARALQQTSNIHRTDYGELLIMPTIHYFTALQASKMLANPDQYKDTWRWEKVQAVLKKFESTYKIKFNDLSEKYVDINDDNQKVKSELQQQNVEFTKELGDGREGVGKFGPLIPRADLNGPDGEPFEPSSAVTWRINKDNKKAGLPSHLRGLNDFGKARVNFREFDYMMNNGIQQYVKDSEKQELVAFLNNETQVDTATKVRMLKLMINNVDHDLREPMPISQALVRAKPQSESMNTFDKFDNLPLAEQLRIIAKVDKKKIDEAWSKKYKDSINCSNPKGFSQKAHCDGKKKKMSERPLTKDEKSDKEKYVKGMKKSKGDFEKRYGKDAKSVMYATATKMAKEGVAEGFKESLPDNDRITTLNKLLADVFPVSDLKKQMLAFQAIPVPQMLNDFRRLRSEAGDDACARSIVRAYINALPKEVQQKINLNEWSKQHISNLLTEAKGIMGRVAGDQFKRNEDTLEFNGVTTYPQDREQFDDPAERDSFVADIEQQLNTQIEWTNVPNNGALAFAIAKLTDPSLDDKPTYWGRYFKKAGVDMMGRWSNSQIPAGWKLQKAGALKMDIAIDPQHLIQNENIYNGIDEVISTVAKNSQGHEIQQELLNGLTSIKNQQHPVFEGQIKNLPAIRDYFGEIMGPVALMAGMVGGQAEDARQNLMNGAEWSSYGVKWPQEMNFALVDSIFIGPDGTEVGISSKGGKGARASSKNIADAIAKASDEMKQTHQFAVKVLTIIQENSAAQGPFRLAEFLGVLPNGLEKEILGYATQGKTDYNGISKSAKELFNYGTPRQDVPGFNTGYALIALLAKKVAKLINENPEFGAGCLAFLNQSSIVQLYCKMGKQGEDARVTGWEAVYPPNFQGTVVLDGSKNYYSSRLGGKFSFGFV